MTINITGKDVGRKVRLRNGIIGKITNVEGINWGSLTVRVADKNDKMICWRKYDGCSEDNNRELDIIAFADEPIIDEQRRLIAVELIQNDFTDAGIYLLTGRKK